jgi:penicillin-binding protein 1A
VVSIVALVLFYGVMDENQSTRVNVAERAKADDVQIDPDGLPIALVQYPATVTGHTSGGQKVSCTIHSLDDEESPSCQIPPSAARVPELQVRADRPTSTAPPASAVPFTHGRDDDDPRVARQPQAMAPSAAQNPTTQNPTTQNPATQNPATQNPTQTPAGDKPGPDNQDTDIRRPSKPVAAPSADAATPSGDHQGGVDHQHYLRTVPKAVSGRSGRSDRANNDDRRVEDTKVTGH